MSDFLTEMAASSRLRLEAAVADQPLHRVMEVAFGSPDPRPLGDFGIGFDVIAEIKPRSPAEGPLDDAGLAERAARYQDGGAGMLSVLTEPEAFGGSLDLLVTIGAEARVPVLRKDFLVDPYQVYEARAAGADGVLIIIRILSDEVMHSMLDAVAACGMFALVEVFDAGDLARSLPTLTHAAEVMIGVNSRDLETLEVDPSTHRRMAPDLPGLARPVAESGIASEGDVSRVAALGYRSVLVGSALMRSPDPAGLVGSMVRAGRAALQVSAQ